MTLIAKVYDPKNGFFAISDTIISYESAYDGNPEILPLQTGLNLGFGTNAVRIASKAVLFDNYIVLWAGAVSSAKKLIQKFMGVNKPTHSDFISIIDKHPELAKDVNLIYACNDGEKVWSADWRCIPKNFNNLTCFAAGTGAEDFLNFENIAPLPDSFKLAIDIPAEVLGYHRLGGLMFLEMTEFVHRYSVFGGAYEMFKPSEGGGFKRLSYSLSEISMKRHLEGDFVNYAGQSRVIYAIGLPEGSFFIVQLGDGLDGSLCQYRIFLINHNFGGN